MDTQISGGWKLIGYTALALIPSFIGMCCLAFFKAIVLAETFATLTATELLLIAMTLACMYVPRWMETTRRRFGGWLMSLLS